MSNPDSSSLTPKFTAENGYSDIWETSTPPPPQHKPPVGRLSHGDEDFWASGIADNDNATSLDITDLTEALSSQTRTKLRGDKFTTESRLAKPVPTDECEYSMSEVADRALPTLEIRSSTTSAAEYNTSVTGRDFALQYCERGRKSLAAKDYAQARSAYKIAVEWDAQLAIAHSGLARVFTQIQDYENALLEWDLAIAIDRSQLDFYYQRALLSS
jgi:tetratricopeptide (TPR) repeat protein